MASHVDAEDDYADEDAEAGGNGMFLPADLRCVAQKP